MNVQNVVNPKTFVLSNAGCVGRKNNNQRRIKPRQIAMIDACVGNVKIVGHRGVRIVRMRQSVVQNALAMGNIGAHIVVVQFLRNPTDVRNVTICCCDLSCYQMVGALARDANKYCNQTNFGTAPTRLIRNGRFAESVLVKHIVSSTSDGVVSEWDCL